MKTFHIKTLGCKVNQYESDGIASDLEETGWKKKGGKGTDVFIINTCAVTSKAGMQSRQAIRKIIRENPDARVIVTGCHAQTDPGAIKKIERMDQIGGIVCHNDKTKIADHLRYNDTAPSPFAFQTVDQGKSSQFHGFKQAVKGEMTRAYLKIQDGCNSFCTYCIVPHARGASVSMPEQDVFRHLEQLNASGFKEVILTGIHTGMYGLDLKKKTGLLQLLEKIDRKKPVHRIRLSSIEPTEISDDIIKLAGPKHILCDHFHLPLQSGDNEILRRMKRPYDADLFERVIKRIHQLSPFAGIGVDTLIGFPSETEKQFENTYELIKRLPVSYLHVFPFSARKGTPAYHMDHKVDPGAIKERSARMRKLGRDKKAAFIKANLNKRLEGLVQNKADGKTGLSKVVTSNYLTILLNTPDGTGGKILDVIPQKCDSDTTMTILGKPAKEKGLF